LQLLLLPCSCDRMGGIPEATYIYIYIYIYFYLYLHILYTFLLKG
jgi:hypothetical protein